MFLTQEKMWQRQAFYWSQLKGLTLAKFLKSYDCIVCCNVEDEGLLQYKMISCQEARSLDKEKSQ